MHTNFYSTNLTYYSGLCPHWESLGLPEPPKFSFYLRNAHQLKEFVEKKKKKINTAPKQESPSTFATQCLDCSSYCSNMDLPLWRPPHWVIAPETECQECSC